MGNEFINYEAKNRYGQTVLLRCSNGCGYGLNAPCIRLLIDHGASVMAKDNCGRTCLHYALDSLRNPSQVSEKESLLLLVKAGADVYAVDDNGISVSDVTYTRSDYDKMFNLGTYRGDLWDEVLTECGYDATLYRGNFRSREDVQRREYLRIFEETILLLIDRFKN